MNHHILIAGASGVTGLGALRAFADSDWKLTTMSRSQQAPSEFPHLSGDFLDKESIARHSEELRNISHIFYAAYKPIDDPKLEAEENGAMFSQLIDAVLEAGADLKRVIFLQGGKVYGAHLGRYKTPAREDDSRHFPPNLYFNHQNYAESLESQGIHWTALRPDIVIGPSLHSAMNLGNLIGVYGTLCRELGVDMHFPGSERAYGALINICSADVLGAAVRWAAEEGKNGAYNITNGDYFRWKQVWPQLAKSFGLQAGEPQGIDMQQRLNYANKETWTGLAHKYQLEVQDIDALAQGSFGDFIFNVEHDAIFDVTKARRAGFHRMIENSDRILLEHLETMRKSNWIP